MKKYSGEERYCQNCSKSFIYKAKGPRLFCSLECRLFSNENKYRKLYRNSEKGQETYFIYRLKNRFNITKDEYDTLISNQNFSCAICKTTKPTGRGGWHVDHCHSRNKVRGLLCSKCNQGLGLFNNNPKHLLTASEYIQAFEEQYESLK